ncbi:GmrSD restriction endonuclease domain-containing protein [Escherichia coli]|uniref:GmrSD restriction endonuclease domain-containing protein n=1 Tax=Escherichia coli TaxID=562 RepID=UPI003A97710B
MSKPWNCTHILEPYQNYFRLIENMLSQRFQREYSWVKEQINELWYDVISNIKLENDFTYSNNEYFIGSLVLVGDETGRKCK